MSIINYLVPGSTIVFTGPLLPNGVVKDEEYTIKQTVSGPDGKVNLWLSIHGSDPNLDGHIELDPKSNDFKSYGISARTPDDVPEPVITGDQDHIKNQFKKALKQIGESYKNDKHIAALKISESSRPVLLPIGCTFTVDNVLTYKELNYVSLVCSETSDTYYVLVDDFLAQSDSNINENISSVVSAITNFFGDKDIYSVTATNIKKVLESIKIDKSKIPDIYSDLVKAPTSKLKDKLFIEGTLISYGVDPIQAKDRSQKFVESL